MRVSPPPLTLVQVYVIPWPSFFTDAISIFDLLMGDLFQLSGAKCFAVWNVSMCVVGGARAFTRTLPAPTPLTTARTHIQMPTTSLLVQTMVPLCLLTVAVLMYFLTPFVKPRKRKTLHSQCVRAAAVYVLVLTYPVSPSPAFVGAFLLMPPFFSCYHSSTCVYFIYQAGQGMSFISLQTLQCSQTIAGVQYLQADYSIECWTSTHFSYSAWAATVVLVVSVGWPVLVFALLYKHRAHLDDAWVVKRYGVMYASFKPRFYLWGVTEIFRKLAMTGLVVFFGRGTSLQVAMGLLLSSIALIAHALLKPFEHESNNMLQLLSLSRRDVDNHVWGALPAAGGRQGQR
jgi:hypothetical protein